MAILASQALPPTATSAENKRPKKASFIISSDGPPTI
jgi:hypothetical protein